MKKIFQLSVLIFCFTAGAGTSVGNFNRQVQKEFDFEVRYPDNWKLIVQSGVTSETSIEHWKVSNSLTVPDPLFQSMSNFSFVRGFPANNETELLREIEKRHPQARWTKVNNPDLVGFESDQVNNQQGSYVNTEYYLADTQKVVQIENKRNAFQNGAAELDLILSTIRKPSRPLYIESVDFNQISYKVGDRACLYIHVDALKVSDNPQIIVRLKQENRLWLFRDSKWDAEKSRFEICQNINRSMLKDALVIESVVITDGLLFIPCKQNGDQIDCPGNKLSKPIIFPPIENPSPDLVGPEISYFAATPDQKGFVIHSQDESGVAFIQIDFSAEGQGQKKQMILYEDELRDFSKPYRIPLDLLKPGYNLISKVTAFDKIGNVTLMTAQNPDKKNYSRIFKDKNTEDSGIPYVSILKGQP